MGIDFHAETSQPIAGPVTMLPQKGSVSGGSNRPLNSYAIRRGDRVVLVDAPFSWLTHALDAMIGDGARIAALVLTHRDLCASGDAFDWFAERHVPVALHADDRDSEKARATGLTYADPFEVVGDGIDVIHLPGHTPGSILLHLPDDGLLLAGDSAVGPGPDQDRTPRLQRPKGADGDDRFLPGWKALAAERRIDGVLPLHGEVYLRDEHADFDAIVARIWDGAPMDPSGG